MTREKCACWSQYGPNTKCPDCNGCGFVNRYLWADGKLHDEPPPSSVPIPIPAPPPKSAENESAACAVAPIIEIPMAWQPSARHLLRQLAMDFALRSAAVMGDRTIKGEDLLRSAERIEQWLVIEVSAP